MAEFFSLKINLLSFCSFTCCPQQYVEFDSIAVKKNEVGIVRDTYIMREKKNVVKSKRQKN